VSPEKTMPVSNDKTIAIIVAAVNALLQEQARSPVPAVSPSPQPLPPAPIGNTRGVPGRDAAIKHGSNDRIMAVIVAAVNHFLMEEAQAREPAASQPARPLPPPSPAGNTWGMSGRDNAMKLGELWQLGIWRKQS